MEIQKYVPFEYQNTLPGGLSRPLLVIAGEEGVHRTKKIVLKLRSDGGVSPIYAGVSSICELVCASIAKKLGLFVPEFGIAHVRSDFIDSIGDRSVRERLRNSLGPNFATVFLGSGYIDWDWTHQSDSDLLNGSIEKVLSFDSILLNGDRTMEKPNLLWDGRESVCLIDHGLACPIHNWDQAIIDTSPFFNASEIQSHCGYVFLKEKRRGYRDLKDLWEERIDSIFLDAIADEIPRDWDRSGRDIGRIIDFLKKRPRKFLELTQYLQDIVR